VRRSQFGHTEVATTHRGRDKPGRIRRLGLDSDSTRTRLGLDNDDDDDDDNVHVVDVGAIDHGDHGDHCLQPVGGLYLAPEEKLVALFNGEKKWALLSLLSSQDNI
jgi:hypothetical protein